MADSKTCDQCGEVRNNGSLWGWVTIQPLAANARHGAPTAELLGDFCSHECVALRVRVEVCERPHYPQTRADARINEVEAAAQIYRENINGAPGEAVAAAFGLSRRTACRRVAEARERGLLPPTTQGKKSA